MSKKMKLQITKCLLDRMEEAFQFLESYHLTRYSIVSKPMYAIFCFISKMHGNIWRNQ